MLTGNPQCVHDLACGTTYGGSCPQTTSPFKWTAGTSITWLMNALAFFGSLVQDATEPTWVCLQLHVKILTALLSSGFSEEMEMGLNVLVFEHQTLYFSIPMYKPMFKYNNHLYGHMAALIRKQTGPPRLQWCMTTERSYSEIKRFVPLINFKNTVKAVAEHWCERRSYSRSTGSKIIACHSMADMYCEVWQETHLLYQRMQELVPVWLDALPPQLEIMWSSKVNCQGFVYLPGSVSSKPVNPSMR